MFIYLIEDEGCEAVAFSSQALAEDYLIESGDFHSAIVRVTLDTHEVAYMAGSDNYMAAREEWLAGSY